MQPSEYPRLAARWWAQNLRPQVTRPATFEDDLTAFIEQELLRSPQGVLLCSRPAEFPLPAPTRPLPPPVDEDPDVEAPDEGTPSDEPTTEEPPVDSPPSDEPPVDTPPTDEPSVEEPIPVEEPPVEAPAEPAPVDNTLQPGWLNGLAVVAYPHLLELTDFRGALMWVYAEEKPEVKLTANGRFRDVN